MAQIEFPNATLNGGWIRGHPRLGTFYFRSCELEIINSFATAHGATANLSITLQLMHPTAIMPAAFDGLHVIYLRFDNVDTNIFIAEFLIPIRNSIRSMYFGRYSCFDTLNMNTVLDPGEWFPALLYFQINVGCCGCKPPKGITASNFTAIPIVRYLFLVNFSITHIEPGAFDSIYTTLKELVLAGNQIQKLSPSVFRPFIENYEKNSVRIDVRFNPFKCNCDLLEIASLSTWTGITRNVSIFQPSIHCEDANAAIGWPSVHECEDLESITPVRLCLSCRATDIFIYSKFSIRVDPKNGRLSIKTAVYDVYRIWIINYYPDGDQLERCPTPRSIQMGIKCLRVHKNIVEIPFKQFFTSANAYMVCVSYVHSSSKYRIWPLNCVSTTESDDPIQSIERIWLYRMLVALIASISGLLCSLMCLKFMIKDKNNGREQDVNQLE